MEFLLYLNPEAKEIQKLLYRARFSFYENISFCKDKDTFGYADFGKKIIICTRNIKRSGYDLKTYINQTFMHESVHAAHFCNGYRAFGISLRDMHLPPNKVQDVRNSVKASTAPHRMEHEAHWMENSPGRIKYVLQKYCL